MVHLPVSAQRPEGKEMLDVTISNLFAPTNLDWTQQHQDKLLHHREKQKANKYDTFARENNTSFRGLAFCDSGRMSKNVHALYSELFKKYEQEHVWEESEDDFRMLWSPKQWSTKSPKQLWIARLLVRILKEREKRVATYIAELKKKIAQRTTPLAISDQVSQ